MSGVVSNGSAVISIAEHDRLRKAEKDLTAELDSLKGKNVLIVKRKDQWNENYGIREVVIDAEFTGLFQDNQVMGYVNDVLSNAKDDYRRDVKEHKYTADKWSTRISKLRDIGFFKRLRFCMSYIFSPRSAVYDITNR